MRKRHGLFTGRRPGARTTALALALMLIWQTLLPALALAETLPADDEPAQPAAVATSVYSADTPPGSSAAVPATVYGQTYTEEVTIPVDLQPALVTAAAAPSAAPAAASSGQVVVRYKTSALPELVAPNAGESVEAAVARLRQDPAVAYAEPNYELRALLGPSQTTSGNERYNYWEVEGQEAWHLALDLLRRRGDAGTPAEPVAVTVAVIDGGVDAAHEDLNGRVLAGVSALDGVPDADATVDDSVYGQGTMVAGLIAATSGNGIGILGASSDFPVSILPVKALAADGAGSIFSVARGIRLAADRGAQVIHLSLGARLPETPQTLAEAVAYAREQGAVVVAAGGEDGGTVAGFHPAATSGVISVGLLPTWGSPDVVPNTGAAVETYGAKYLLSLLPGDQYGQIWARGSSALSAAFVSAAAALTFSVLPDRNGAEVAQALLAGERPDNVCYRFTPEDPGGDGGWDEVRYTCDSFSIFQAVFMATWPPRVATERVSVHSNGAEGDGGSEAPAISADGRYVAFASDAGNLVDGDTNGRADIFVHDRTSRRTVRVSVYDNGHEADSDSYSPAISADGRFVAFRSHATTFLPGINQNTCRDYYGNLFNCVDVFLHDRDADGNGTFDEPGGIRTVQVSVGPGGVLANSTSEDPAISADGRYVAFASVADNLVADDTNACQWATSCTDIFVYDRLTGAIERVSVGSLGQQGNDNSFEPAISADGRYVAFRSMADNLVDGDATSGWNGQDIFVHDRETGATVRVSVATDGTQGNDKSVRPAISGNGRFVAFQSDADNLVADDTNGGDDIFVHDRDADGNGVFDLTDDPADRVATERVSLTGNGDPYGRQCDCAYSYNPSIGADGRYVAFESDASDLVLGDSGYSTDVFVHNRQTGQTVRASVSTAGAQGNFNSGAAAISADGRYVAFESRAYNLVPDDSNKPFYDIFVAELAPPDHTAPTWPDRSLTARDIGPDRLTLTWLPAQDEQGVAAYRLYQDGVLLATVTGTTHQYQVTGLAPNMEYAFRVEAGDGAGNWSTDGPSLTVTTAAPADTAGVSLAWRVAGGRTGGVLPDQATINVILTAPSGLRSVVADAVYRFWYGADGGLLETPRSVTATVDLAEEAADPGTYLGGFSLPAGTSELTSITWNGAGVTTGPVLAVSLPKAVAGSLAVDVEAPDGGDALAGSRLVAWSGTAGAGAVADLDGPGRQVLGDLTPAADYVVRIVATGGRELARQAGVTVLAGREGNLPMSPLLPASLRVRVLGTGGQGMSGVGITLINDTTGRFIRRLTTGADGWTPAVTGFVYGDTIRGEFRLSDQPYQTPAPVTFSLTSGANEPTVSLQPLPTGTLNGAVRTPSPELLPLADARVTASQLIDGRTFVRSAVSGEDGTYSLDLLAGEARVEVSSPIPRYVGPPAQTVAIPDGGTESLDVAMDNLGPGTVTVAIYTKDVGGEWQGPMSIDWRVAVHFHLQVTNARGNVWGGYPYPVQITARPGETVRVCIDGVEAGLPQDCQDVVLDGERNGRAEFWLMKQGGRIKGSLRWNDQPVRFPWRAVAYLVADTGRTATGTFSGSQAGFDFPVPREGNYELVFQEQIPAGSPDWLRPRQARAQTPVSSGSSVELPAPVSFRTSGVFEGRPGQQVAATPGTTAPGGRVTFRAGYTYLGDSESELQNVRLRLDIPAGATLIPESVVVDGPNQGGGVTGSVYEVRLGNFTPVTAPITGTVRYQVYLPQDTDLAAIGVNAYIKWDQWEWQDGSPVMVEREEILGSALVAVEGVTISAPERLARRDTVLSGRAPASSQVRVYEGSLLLGVTEAGPGGIWLLPVTLPERGSRTHYRLRAQTEAAGVPRVSPVASVLFDHDRPVITRFSMQQQDGRLVSFDPAAGVARFPYVFVPSYPMTFNMDFTNSDLVSDVRVSLGDRETEATRAGDTFTATTTPSGNLGPIKVSYETRPNPDVYKRPAPSEADFRQMAPPELSGFTVSSKTDATPANPTGIITFTVPGKQGLTATMELTVRQVSYTPSAADTAQVQASGIPIYGFTANLPTVTTPTNTLMMEVSGYIPEDAITQSAGGVLSVMAAALGGRAGKDRMAAAVVPMNAGGSFIQVAGRLIMDNGNTALNVVDWTKSLKDGFGVPGTFQQVEQLMNQATGCNTSAANAYLDALEAAGNKVMMFEALKWGMQLASVFLAPATFGVGSVVLFGASQVIQDIMDRNVAGDIDLVRNSIANNSSCNGGSGGSGGSSSSNTSGVANPVWIYDPSGYVYEAVHDNRVEGVTATALWSGTGGAPGGPWSVWDAEWYGQENPQVTDAQGKYGWDVPEGWWQVAYEKEGYEPAESWVMYVPPPRTEVNVGMVSLAPPAVAGVAAAAGGGYIEVAFDKYMLAGTLTDATVSVTVSGGAHDGETVAGTVYALSPVNAANGATVSRTARFSPAAPLTVGGQYTVTVSQAVQSYAERPMAAGVVQTVTVPAVGDVSGVSVTPGEGRLTVTWTDPADAALAQVRVYWRPAGAAGFSGPAGVAKGVQSYVITGLVGGTTYEIRLTTVDTAGNESAGITVNGTPAAPASDHGGIRRSGGSSLVLAALSDELRVDVDGSAKTVTAFDGALVLDIAVDTFAPGTVLVLRMVFERVRPGLAGLVPASAVFEVAAGAAGPGKPVTVGIRYDEAGRSGADVRKLGIYRQDDNDPSRWTYVGGAVDPAAGVVRVRLTGFSRYTVMAYNRTFDDLRGHWSQKDVEVLASRHLVRGVSDAAFQPERAITRAELVKLLVEMLARDPDRGVSVTAPAAPTFTDVAPGAWYYAYVETAARHGIVRGSDGRFRPVDPVTREEMAVMIIRAMGLETRAVGAAGEALPYEDAAHVTDWARGHIALAQREGLMRGMTAAAFAPRANATRAQGAAVVLRAMERLGLIQSR